MGIDVFLFLREHIQNHSSLSSFVKLYNTPFNCNLVHQSVLNGYLIFDTLCEKEREFYCYVCGYHLSTLIMDLNKKIAFKMPTEEFEEITIDRNNIEPDIVDMDSFWEKIELAVISKAFTRSNMKSLNIKPNLHYLAPYIGKKTRSCSNILNTEHRKVKTTTEKNIENDDCMEMTEERLLEMLPNDILRKVKSAAETCKVSIVGCKMDIIIRIKAAALKNGKRFRKFFSKIWGNSGGCLSFSCPHGVVSYLNFCYDLKAAVIM